MKPKLVINKITPMLFLTMILSAMILWLMHGCASREVLEKPFERGIKLERVLFLPMKNMARIYGENTGVMSPLTGKYFVTGKVMASAESFFTDQMMNALKTREGLLILPADHAAGANAEMLADGRSRLNEKSRAAELGQKMGADAVITGNIFRFEDRVGTRHSVESSAAVAFEMCLISTMDGSTLWSESYTEKQISLSENLFNLGTFIRRKARWVTAEEMASFAIAEMMRTFPE